MVLFGAPYYCLELYIAYTGRNPSDYVLALAGGAAVAPSSIDPWIFLLFWVNWSEPANDNHNRRLIHLSAHQQQLVYSRRVNRSNTMGSSSSSEPCVNHHQVQVSNAAYLSANANKRTKPLKKQEHILVHYYPQKRPDAQSSSLLDR